MALTRPTRANQSDIDRLMQQPYWVIDVLPAQVPAYSGGQFFEVEPLLLRGARQKFANTLLKLNCYYDFCVFEGEESVHTVNPAPGELASKMLHNDVGLSIVLPAADALIATHTQSTCMTLYGPTPELLELITRIATSEGLFVWQPKS